MPDFLVKGSKVECSNGSSPTELEPPNRGAYVGANHVGTDVDTRASDFKGTFGNCTATDAPCTMGLEKFWYNSSKSVKYKQYSYESAMARRFAMVARKYTNDYQELVFLALSNSGTGRLGKHPKNVLTLGKLKLELRDSGLPDLIDALASDGIEEGEVAELLNALEKVLEITKKICSAESQPLLLCVGRDQKISPRAGAGAGEKRDE